MASGRWHSQDHAPRRAVARRRLAALVLALTMGLGGASAGAQTSLTKLPGYVDLSRFLGSAQEQPNIEVNLSGGLLTMLSEAVKDEDPEFADLLSKLKLVRVRLFEHKEGEKAVSVASAWKLLDQLESQGWEAVVRVRDDQDQVCILVRPAEKAIAGLVALFVDEDQTGVVNIVGDFDPVQLGRLGRRLHIDPLQALAPPEKAPAPAEEKP